MQKSAKTCLIMAFALLAAKAEAQFPALSLPKLPGNLTSVPVVKAGRPIPFEPALPTIRLQNSESEASAVSLRQPQPVFRGQGPPPPPLPPTTATLSGDEAFNCGVVPHENSGNFFSDCWGRCCDMCRGFSVTGIFQPGPDRGVFQSDQEFKNFSSPVTNPFYLEDPRALTEVRPIFIWQRTPSSNQGWAGGNNFFVGAQARVALTPSFSVVISKLGWIFTDPDPANTATPPLTSENGFAELHVGPKFTIIRNEDSKTLLAAGVNFEIPVGSSRVFQDTGSLSVVPYISYGQTFFDSFTYGGFNFINTTGYTFRTDDIRSEFLFSSFHLDWNIGNLNRFYPLVEINWFHYVSNGNATQPFNGFEGADMFNFGNQGISGNDELIVSIGGRWKPRGQESFQIGLAGGYNVLDQDRSLNNFILTADMIFRY